MDDGRRACGDTLLPIWAPMHFSQPGPVAARDRARPSRWVCSDHGGTSAGGARFHFFLEGNFAIGGSRICAAAPETFAMVDGRMFDEHGTLAVDSRDRTPRTRALRWSMVGGRRGQRS